MFDGNTNSTSTKRIDLACEVQARYVRFHPIHFKGGIALNVDVLGCPLVSGIGKEIIQKYGLIFSISRNRDKPWPWSNYVKTLYILCLRYWFDIHDMPSCRKMKYTKYIHLAIILFLESRSAYRWSLLGTFFMGIILNSYVNK